MKSLRKIQLIYKKKKKEKLNVVSKGCHAPYQKLVKIKFEKGKNRNTRKDALPQIVCYHNQCRIVIYRFDIVFINFFFINYIRF